MLTIGSRRDSRDDPFERRAAKGASRAKTRAKPACSGNLIGLTRSGIDDDERTAIDPAGAEAQKGGDSIRILDGDGGASAASMSQFDAQEVNLP
jgi:hypothetical protein